jgi:hypothetical protein
MTSPSERRRKAEQLYQCNPQFKAFVDQALSMRMDHQFSESDLTGGVTLALEMATRKSGVRPATSAWGIRTIKPGETH